MNNRKCFAALAVKEIQRRSCDKQNQCIVPKRWGGDCQAHLICCNKGKQTIILGGPMGSSQ